jgi:hypothetical protein
MYTSKNYFLTDTSTEVTGFQYSVHLFHSSANKAISPQQLTGFLNKTFISVCLSVCLCSNKQDRQCTWSKKSFVHVDVLRAHQALSSSVLWQNGCSVGLRVLFPNRFGSSVILAISKLTAQLEGKTISGH